ncbi:hypothetical protein CCHR01_02910 [Colletotrichum chrysophilum]|uniref:Uncharacterized protein n=1 Tax=Colletotrichum chrysophilum TaxID=1836956 RepID=A0AAD9AXK0_9PEZI|nr:hypothetical protein CCHR01_02910 [Colletotrichum chrysophilum]
MVSCVSWAASRCRRRLAASSSRSLSSGRAVVPWSFFLPSFPLLRHPQLYPDVCCDQPVDNDDASRVTEGRFFADPRWEAADSIFLDVRRCGAQTWLMS